MASVVGNTMQSPWKFVGAWLHGSGMAQSHGSGVLLGQNYVLTAGHVYGGDDLQGIRNFFDPHFVPGLDGTNQPFGSAGHNSVGPSINTFTTQNGDAPDIALVRVHQYNGIPTGLR